jgi:hypothetical protein
MRLEEHVAYTWEKVVLEKRERKRQLGRPRRRWNGNIKMGHAEEERHLGGFQWVRIEVREGLL